MKQYTISTLIFKSLKEAEDQVRKWHEKDKLYYGTTVFEIKESYKPILKLVKVKENK